MCPYRESSSPRSAFVEIPPLTVTFHVDRMVIPHPTAGQTLRPGYWDRHNEGVIRGAMNNRRKLVIALGAGTLDRAIRLFRSAAGQKVWRVGFVSGRKSRPVPYRLYAVLQGLRELGYIEGKNILDGVSVRWRHAGSAPLASSQNLYSSRLMSLSLPKSRIDLWQPSSQLKPYRLYF